MQRLMRKIIAGTSLGLMLGGVALPGAEAQRPVVYPAKGQSPEQQQKDQTECDVWAKQTTRRDPRRVAAAPPPASGSTVGGGQRLGGAARGAAGGRLIGAIAGTRARARAAGAVVGNHGRRPSPPASSEPSRSRRPKPRSSRRSTPTTERSGRAWRVAAMPSSKRARARHRVGLAVGIGLLLATTPTMAGDFDGSRLLICAPVQAFDCAPGEECAKGLPEEIGAPRSCGSTSRTRP
jgi:hypothetical protein